MFEPFSRRMSSGKAWDFIRIGHRRLTYNQSHTLQRLDHK
jgi:hypothetical protein